MQRPDAPAATGYRYPPCRKCGEENVELNSDDVCFDCWGNVTPWWKTLLWALRNPGSVLGG